MAKKKPEIDLETLTFSVPGQCYDELTRLGTSMGLNENSTAKLMLLNALFVRLAQDVAAEEGARKAAKEQPPEPSVEVQVPVPEPALPGIEVAANAARALELAQSVSGIEATEHVGHVYLYDLSFPESAASPEPNEGERFLVVRKPLDANDSLEAWCGEDELEARSVYEAFAAQGA